MRDLKCGHAEKEINSQYASDMYDNKQLVSNYIFNIGLLHYIIVLIKWV